MSVESISSVSYSNATTRSIGTVHRAVRVDSSHECQVMALKISRRRNSASWVPDFRHEACALIRLKGESTDTYIRIPIHSLTGFFHRTSEHPAGVWMGRIATLQLSVHGDARPRSLWLFRRRYRRLSDAAESFRNCDTVGERIGHLQDTFVH